MATLVRRQQEVLKATAAERDALKTQLHRMAAQLKAEAVRETLVLLAARACGCVEYLPLCVHCAVQEARAAAESAVTNAQLQAEQALSDASGELAYSQQALSDARDRLNTALDERNQAQTALVSVQSRLAAMQDSLEQQQQRVTAAELRASEGNSSPRVHVHVRVPAKRRDTTHLPAGATTAQRFQESLAAAKEGEAMGLARCAELEAEVQQLRWVGGAVRYHVGLFCLPGVIGGVTKV